MLLSKEQRLGAIILLTIALIGWLIVALHSGSSDTMTAPTTPDTPKKQSWEQRKDSMRRADSLRYAQWTAEREQRYDSFRLADSIRRAEWKTERQAFWDSTRHADSLWRDSVGFRYAPRVKKDTILDLNHCDTTELQFIRGIGRYTATQIVRYRVQLGGYYSPSQLTDEALSKCHLDTLKHHFTTDTNAIQKLRINSCEISTLQRHPYIRYNQAKAIYELRRKRLKIHSMDELKKLPEFTEQELDRIAPYLFFE